jgi:predicted O-methyltransferase YrrM
MMITGVVEGRFLEFLVFWGKPKKILEIGCFTGMSTLSCYNQIALTRLGIQDTVLCGWPSSFLRAERL